MSTYWVRPLLVTALLLCAGTVQAKLPWITADPSADSNDNGTLEFLPSTTEAVPLIAPMSGELQEIVPEQRWTAWAGAIILQRTQPTNQPLIVDAGQASLFNADQIGFFIQAGPDLNAIYHGKAFDVDFRYFHVNQANAIDSMASAGVDEFLNLHTPLFLDDSPVDFNYTTSIQSVELNLRRNYTERLTLLAGFRYISLRDDLGAGFFPPGGAPWSVVHMVGINRLYGAQIGADMILLDGGRWQIQCASKAGIYGNGAQSLGTLVSPQTSDISNSVSRSMTSFIGDINFTGVYAINDHWAVRGGYQLLWLNGVALGSDQYSTNSYVYAFDAGVADGDLFLHGALVSLQFSW
jgi:hypothetical protein